MARKSYIQIGGKLYDKAELSQLQDAQGMAAPTILADAPDFISPIDGSLVRGRAGLRDHCARHNVVPTAELKGLPPKPMVNHQVDPAYREATRRTIANIIDDRGYFGRK